LNNSFLSRYLKIIFSTGKGLNWVSMVLLGILALLSLFDVLGRTLFSAPIPGGYELTELVLTLMVAFGLGNSELLRKHVRVDLLMASLSTKVRKKFDMFHNLISCGIFFLIGYRNIMHGLHLHQVGTNSGLLHIPLMPFVVSLGIGFVVIGAVFLSEFFDDLVRGAK
jgi:TRAP-type C4-dicarboxylate transport system permease small subunit